MNQESNLILILNKTVIGFFVPYVIVANSLPVTSMTMVMSIIALSSLIRVSFQFAPFEKQFSC